MRRSYHGSCHCGTVRFECELDLAEGTSRCNCSICTKMRFWKSIVKGEAFRLLQGEDALVDYQFGGNDIHHLFCSRCSVNSRNDRWDQAPARDRQHDKAPRDRGSSRHPLTAL